VSDVTARPAGDRAVLLELPDTDAAVRVARRLKDTCPELIDVVPGHRTVLAVWSTRPDADLTKLAAAALDEPSPDSPASTFEIPVAYDGPDLADVARLTHVSPEEVVARHTRPDYVVAFIGFAPGFAYLVGGDERLYVARRAEPRERVPAGSVAVAGPYSGIYPRDGPGGWQLLGRTTTTLFDPTRQPPATLAAGDHVHLVPQ
jgi:KipI family sensor histidine kinase inhibitor